MGDSRRPLITIAGLWLKKTDNAGSYLAGKMGTLAAGFELKPGDRVWVFRNKKPKQANSPTHFLMAEDTRVRGRNDDDTGDPGDEEGPNF